jgi:hypothetical protein
MNFAFWQGLDLWRSRFLLDFSYGAFLSPRYYGSYLPVLMTCHLNRSALCWHSHLHILWKFIWYGQNQACFWRFFS